MKKLELLAPVGNYERLEAAINYGADAVYFGGTRFGLRAFANKFDEELMTKAVNFCHENGVKAYITVNILAHNADFEGLVDYLKFLESIKVDALIVSDLGIASLVKKYTNLELHVSTQANITNKFSAMEWVKLGAKRLVLARELSLPEIKEIKEYVGNDVDIECFVHGAMCISYSGRCQLSNYFTGRDSNKGACAQPCRWNYAIYSKNEESDLNEYYPIEEDERGTYILNSKDLCLINHIKELADAGITSFKIEGRMKSSYYVANITNAYRRALDAIERGEEVSEEIYNETFKSSHRNYATGFYFGKPEQNLETSMPVATHEFVAVVLEDAKDGKVFVEMRNRFEKGDELEVLSPNETFNKKIIVSKMANEQGEEIEVAKNVQEKLWIETNLPLKTGDILREKN